MVFEIRPVVIVGIGPRAQKTVQQYVRLVGERNGDIPSLLPVVITYSPNETSFRREWKDVQTIALSRPVFDNESDWPRWLPPELGKLSAAQREGTRAWMRASLMQRIDDLQEYLLGQIPRLLSFTSVEQLSEMGLQLAENSEIDVYVVADMGDPLGSGIMSDIVCLIASVCRQVGLNPLVSGLLYLPDATSPAPMEEAIAYAALKELEHYTGENAFVSAPASSNLESLGSVPLNNGCYLLDTVNEAGYTLQGEEQLLATVCEHLYAMTFLNLESVVREHRNQRYQRATLRGKGRVYESFGIAIRYVPRGPLLDWATARLGGDMIESVLNEQPEVNVDQRVRSFIDRVGLRVETLESALRQTDITETVEKQLASLRQTGIKQLESRSRAVLQTIREQYLPPMAARAREKRAQELDHIQEAFAEEIQMTLNESPVGGIHAALSFLDRLSSELSELSATVQQQVKRHQSELSHSLGTVSETYYALRSVTMGTPPGLITFFCVLTALLVPLLYQMLLIYRVILPQSVSWAQVVSTILAAGVLGVSGFVTFRLLYQRRVLAEQHAHMVRERFQLESDPVIQQEVSIIYDEVARTAARAMSDLQTFSTQLQVVGERFERTESTHAGHMKALTLPGPSRSVIDAEIAEHFYSASVPDMEYLVSELVGSAGSIPDWLARCIESEDTFEQWVYDQMWNYGALYLQDSVANLAVTDALTSNGTRLESIVERLFERAYPLWNYDPRFLRRAKTERMTFVGANTEESGWARMAEVVAQAQPEMILHHTGDSSALIVVTVHQGVPLFALRRIGQYRNHYAEALWRGKLPIHTTNTLALADDLIPMRRRMQTSPATLFSAGLALDVIHRDPDGRYVAPRSGNKTIRLSAHKERAVALMSMDGPTCREVQRRLEALVNQRGAKAVDAHLEEYATDVPGLADWEVRGIVGFCQIYKRENGSLAHSEAAQPMVREGTRPLQRG